MYVALGRAVVSGSSTGKIQTRRVVDSRGSGDYRL